MGFFDRGEDAIRRDEQREQRASESRRRKGTSEYRLDPGKKGRILMLDDGLFFVMRHVKSGKKDHWTATCAGEEKDCRGCDDDIPLVDFYVAGTIINLTGFVNDEGKRIRYYKQALPLKRNAKAEMLHQRERFKKKHGKEAPFAMLEWEVRRDPDPKSERTGTRFELIKRWTKKKFKAFLESKGVTRDDWKEFLSPFDYEEVYAAPSDKEWDKLLGHKAGVRPGSQADEDDGWDDDEDEKPEVEEDDDFDEDEEEEKPKRKKEKKSKKKAKGNTKGDFVNFDEDDESIEDVLGEL